MTVEEKFNAMLRRATLRISWYGYPEEVYDDVAQTIADNWMVTLPLILDTLDLYVYSGTVRGAYLRIIPRMPINALIYLDTVLELNTFKLKEPTIALLRTLLELAHSSFANEVKEARAKYSAAVRRNEEMKKRILREVRGS